MPLNEGEAGRGIKRYGILSSSFVKSYYFLKLCNCAACFYEIYVNVPFSKTIKFANDCRVNINYEFQCLKRGTGYTLFFLA